MKIASRLLLNVCILGTTSVAAFAQVMPAAAPPPAGATKVCAPFAPNVFRTVTPTPGTWSIDDCRGMASAIGAPVTQVGCFFEKDPAGLVTKYVFGGTNGSANPPTPGMVPSPNCGW